MRRYLSNKYMMNTITYKFKMFKITKKAAKISFVSIAVLLCIYFNIFVHLFERDFCKYFQYDNMNTTAPGNPTNTYSFRFLKTCGDKCKNIDMLELVLLIKSAPENRERRKAIRSTWGDEHPFSDVQIRRVFIIGVRDSPIIQRDLDQESSDFQDIVQADFLDYYYNNTIKTMMGFKWVMEYCSRAKFYFFVDDDYYVSIKNVLLFLRNSTNYPQSLSPQLHFEHARLYAGHVRKLPPQRHFSSKWYVSLAEYAYDLYPPFVNAGAYILSKEALSDMYQISFYTKHFKFDDVYVALLAFNCKIEPTHCDQFYFDKLPYDPKKYESVVASHGYDNPNELVNVWNNQRTLGHA